MSVSVAPKPTTRLAFIDNLRVWLTVLVVAHHAALVYGNIGAWPNWERPAAPEAGLPLDLLVLLNQSYFMACFFLLAGFVAPGSVDRKGPRAFAVDRLKRLGIPFVAFVALLRPLYTLPTYLDLPDDARPSYLVFFLTESDIGPMWFLEVLLAASLAYAWLRRRDPEPPTDRRPRELRARHLVAFALALGIVSYGWRVLVPVGTYVPVVGLPSAASLPHYLAFFTVGVVAFRNSWLQSPLGRGGLLAVGLLVGSFVPLLALDGVATLSLDAAPPPGALPHLGFALWESTFATGTILLLVTVFRRYARFDGRVARFLSANAYAVFLLHAPVIVGVAALAGPLDWSPVAKFALVFPVAAVASWLIAAALRRIPAVRSIV